MGHTKQLKFSRKELRLISILLEFVDVDAMQRQNGGNFPWQEVMLAKSALSEAAYRNSHDRRTGRLGEMDWDIKDLCQHALNKEYTRLDKIRQAGQKEPEPDVPPAIRKALQEEQVTRLDTEDKPQAGAIPEDSLIDLLA